MSRIGHYGFYSSVDTNLRDETECYTRTGATYCLFTGYRNCVLDEYELIEFYWIQKEIWCKMNLYKYYVRSSGKDVRVTWRIMLSRSLSARSEPVYKIVSKIYRLNFYSKHLLLRYFFLLALKHIVGFYFAAL